MFRLLGSIIDFHLLLKIDEFMASDLVLLDTNLVCECLVKLHIDVIVSRWNPSELLSFKIVIC